MRRRLRRSRRAVWSLRILYVLVFVGVFGDFIANDKPLYCKIDGGHYFPVLRQYAVDLGLSTWEARFVQNTWRDQPYEAVVFPPIPYTATTLDLKNSNYRSPFAEQKVASLRWRHWFGTDRLGHDVLAGLIAGTRVALLVGLIAMSIAAAIGILAGAFAGYFGDHGFRLSRTRLILNIAGLFAGWFYGFPARSYAFTTGGNSALLTGLLIFAGALLLANVAAHLLEKIPAFGKRISVPVDLLVMRTIEVLNSVPGLLLLLSFVAVLHKSSVFYVMVIIGLIRWTGIARFLRAELLKIKNMGYVEAARAMGFSDWRILWRHALPNALGPVLITIAFGVASAILLESVLSFLGLGVGEEGMTWGKLLAEARRYPAAWWLALFPGGAIFVAVTIFNLIGEGLTEK